MEPRFRSIPLTIIDFLAILLPGVVWLFLLVATWQFLADDEIAPHRVMRAGEAGQPLGLTVVAALVASALLGYALKPVALGGARFLTRRVLRARRRLPFDRSRHRDWTFPFTADHESEPYFVLLCDALQRMLGCDVRSLPRYGPFTVTKRFLRQASPPLWEEAERSEAEVRMLGMLVLTAFYSLALATAVFVFRGFDTAYLGWVGLSAVAFYLLVTGFDRAQRNEVYYMYINGLIALRVKPPAAGSGLAGEAQGE